MRVCFILGWFPGGLLLLSQRNRISCAVWMVFKSFYICSDYFVLQWAQPFIECYSSLKDIGFCVGVKFSKSRKVDGLFHSFAFLILQGLTIFFVVLAAPKIIELAPGLFLGRTSLLDLRQDHWASFRAGGFGILKAVGRTAVILLAIYIFLCKKKRNLLPSLIMWIGLASFLLDGLLLGGRANLLFLVVALFFAYLVSNSYFFVSSVKSISFGVSKGVVKLWHFWLLQWLCYLLLLYFHS